MADYVRTRVRAAGLAVGAVAALLIGSCDKKPGGQVVAVVNSDEITQAEIRAEASAAGIQPTQDFQVYAPGVLQRVIDRNLLAGLARDQGLDRGPEYVARRRQLDQSLLADLALRKIIATAPPSAAAVQAFVRQNPAMFANRQQLTLDQVRFAMPADPRQVKALAALGSISAVAERLQAQGVRMARGTATLDTGTVEPLVARQVAALQDGQVFDLSTGGTTFISAITARRSIPVPVESWPTIAAPILRRDTAQKGVADTLSQLRKKANIAYDTAFKPTTPR